jgi:hypothetical protein
MHTFEQHIGGHEHFLATEIHYGTVVSDAFLCTRLLGLDIIGEMFDEPKLT